MIELSLALTLPWAAAPFLALVDGRRRAVGWAAVAVGLGGFVVFGPGTVGAG